MLTAKTNRSGLSDSHNGKNAQTNPRNSKFFRGGSTKSESGSPALLRSSSSCVDRLPKSMDSTPTAEHRSLKIISTSDKLARPTKTLALQPKAAVLQEELKRTRDQLASVEQEKLKAVEELNDAKRTADENYKQLNEALAARKKEEENSKIAKARADKIEQVGIEAVWEKEEEFQKEIDCARNQHNLDVLALLSATKELEMVRQELALVSDARDKAISHSHDAMKIAEINAEKVDSLSSEINQLNALLDSRTDSLSNENEEIVKKLNLEIDCLKSEIEKTELAGAKLAEMEVLLEVLNTEVNVAKMGELDAIKLVDELKKQIESLIAQLREAKLSQKSSKDLSDSVSQQLEDCKVALLDSESELAALKEKANSLDIEVVQNKEDLKNSERRLREARMEASEMAETVVALKSEVQNLELEKSDAIENEKIADSEIESLSEEKKKLLSELETARHENQNSKKTIEELASALRKVSLEARETREILLEKHTEIEDAYAQAQHLRLALTNTEESYQVMLDEARYEIICLKKSIERNQTETESLVKELDVTKSESEPSKGAECQVDGTDTVRVSENVDSLNFKERLFDLDDSIVHERKAVAIDRIKELSIFLAEPKTTKPKGSVLPNSDNEYEFIDTDAIHGEKTRPSLGIQGSKLGFPVYKCDVKSIDDEPDSKMASRSCRKVNILSSQDFNGDSQKLIRVQEVKVKKALLNKLGNLLKKRSNFK